MPNFLKTIATRLAYSNTRWMSLYNRVCRPGGDDWASLLKHHGILHSMGDNVSILPGTEITDPAYTRIGNNVRLSMCTLIGHDGSVNMVNMAYGTKLDAVGKIDIRDNVFIGHGAIVLPGVTIGPNAIVSAGTVVNRDVGEGEIVSGVPAKVVGQLDMHVAILTAKNKRYPWADLIEKRVGNFDPEMEPELRSKRVEYFFSEDS